MPSPGNNSNKGGGGSMGSKKQSSQSMMNSSSTTNSESTSINKNTKANSSSSTSSSSTTKKSSPTITTTNGLLEYIQVSLPRKSLLNLYVEDNRGRFVVRAVLQQLNQISQQIIMRLHCTGGSFPLSGIQLWIISSSTTTSTLTNKDNSNTMQNDIQNILLKDLYKWAIIQDYTNNTNNNPDITLTEQFSKGLCSSLSSLESSPWIPLTLSQIETIHQQYIESSAKDSNNTSSTTSTSTITTRKNSTSSAAAVAPPPLVLPTMEDLERYTQLQWDTVLHFLVGTVDKKAPPPAVVSFLLQTDLMRPDPDSKSSSNKNSNVDDDDVPLVITTKGYDFMLQDSYQQIWHFIIQYLHSIEQHPKGEVLLKEVLLLLICLTFARPGCPYAASSLKKDCRTMIKDLSLFGLLCTMKIGKTTIFYPTRLAIQLVGSGASASSTSSSSNLSSASNNKNNALWSISSKVLESSLNLPDPSDSSHLAIIVQTNFQLAAYTTSELHVSMLGLFCDVGTIRRLPNVVFMQITRDSIKSAFALGIQAQQILRFLEKHTHPKLRSNTVLLYDSPVPSNVVDQIWLWDRELSRVQFIKVYQHTCVMGIDEYKAVLQYVVDKKYYNYTNERKQFLLFDYKHYDRIQSFVRQWRAQSISRNNQK